MEQFDVRCLQADWATEVECSALVTAPYAVARLEVGVITVIEHFDDCSAEDTLPIDLSELAPLWHLYTSLSAARSEGIVCPAGR